MDNFIIIAVILIAVIIYFIVRAKSSRSRAINQGKDNVSTKVNLIVGDTPPPNAAIVYPDGKIGRTPDSPEIRNEWIVQKMTYKIEREPNDSEWYFERGKALIALGKFSEAIPDFGMLVELFPTYGIYYQLRGLCYFHSGDKEHALTDLRHYKELWKSDRLDADTIKILESLEERM